MNEMARTLYAIVDGLRGIASNLNAFARNIYEVERAHQIMELAARLAALADARPENMVREELVGGSWQHFSPVIGVEAFVLNDRQEVLLIQRRDSAQWALPGGIAEIGQTFSQAVLRELYEEAGLRGRVTRLLGILDGSLWQTESVWHLVYLMYQVECRDLSPKVGIEALDAGFFAGDHLPDMHPGHEVRVNKCFELLDQPAYFDPADSFDSDMPTHQRPDEET
ncbi:MAG: NUDIX domain-containing protein [Anaerolineae bacterium]|nr:NUDIX domain-containing protein [Anaerolineae bacterium]